MSNPTAVKPMMNTKQIRPFHTVLVANRGEIAVRIMRTARRLGYGTVAVYSDADRDSLHVRLADRAVWIGAAPPAESYLNIAAICNAAIRTGADAVHPGYGFLAENEDFAAAVEAAGLIFIGPTPAAIHSMGNKAQAKRLMVAVDIPCIPGYQDEDQSDAAFLRAAKGIGYPVMVKAAAGGGGRGMRLVHKEADLLAALASARSEAAAAFGSSELILERAVIAPRHVEIQLLADSHGHVIHLGERDCSVQRRHQKVIEEAPSPAVDADLRARMGAAAVRSAQAIGYIGAGTTEFLLDSDGRFYFMEMNTRLQVEHAVTEAITGLDLVEWQLRIAAGEHLTLQQEDVCLRGHAMEARLLAEDVEAGFLPQTGPVLRWRSPQADSGLGHDVRVDHALIEGGTVSPYYDSMVAKLVAHGATRDEARRKLLRAVEDCLLLGVTSNQGFLADCLAHPAFAAGAVHTGFVTEHFGNTPQPRNGGAEGPLIPLALAALATAAQRGAAPGQPAQLGSSHVVPMVRLTLGQQRWQVRLQAQDGQWLVSFAWVGQAEPSTLSMIRARYVSIDGRGVLRAECNGILESAVIVRDDTMLHLFHGGRTWRFQVESAHKPREEQGADGLLTAPLTGRVAEVAVHTGQTVRAGQSLLALEAMKMIHTIVAPIAGVVAELYVQAGGQTSKGALLVRIEPDSEETSDEPER
jgi:geranyl-CoA carboxylase alpha subunit